MHGTTVKKSHCEPLPQMIKLPHS